MLPEVRALHEILGGRISEPMLFGIGGGIGACYFVFEYKGLPPQVYIGTRFGQMDIYKATFLLTICKRIGARATVREGKSALMGATLPALAWVDRAGLHPMPPHFQGTMPHGVVVRRADAREVETSEGVVPAKKFEAARMRMKPLKGRVMTVEPPQKVSNLKKAAREGARDFMSQLLNGAGPKHFARNFGLASLEKWAALLVDRKDKKGWPTMLPPGPRLAAALRWARYWIAPAGLRDAYAEFDPRWRPIAGLWKELADALVPEPIRAVPPWEKGEFPVAESIYEDLSCRVRAISEAERAAAQRR